MFFVSLLRYALHLLVPVSFLLTTYLYLYPAFHLCAFPSAIQDSTHAPSSTYLSTLLSHTLFSSLEDSKRIAPFRLLALGDPQLEGDSSLDYVDSVNFPRLQKFWKDVGLREGSHHSGVRERLRHSLHDLVDFYLDDIPHALEVWRKRLDHVGNDYYLGHIYRSLHWWSNPTHVTVLGDLVGSQWIDDAEFEHRGWRFWERVFKGAVKVPEELYSSPSQDFQGHLTLGEDAEEWKKRIINVAGNHDIGYAGDISQDRMARFTRVFGKANYEMRFRMPNTSNTTSDEEERPIPELRIVVLNDMNLDTPAGVKELQDETYEYLNQVITSSLDVEREAHFTIVLTHIPLYKQAGVCVDGPFFDFFDEGNFNNGVKEQNHLSMDASKGFLEGIFGMSGNPSSPGEGLGRNGVILTGHDHEGCDVFHYINHTEPPEREWKATTWNKALSGDLLKEAALPGLREITVRSMMGGFNGNAGLMSLWFDEATWEWQFEFVNCRLGTQHIWWAVHIVDLITVGVAIVYAGFLALENFRHFNNMSSKPTSVIREARGKEAKILEPKIIESKTLPEPRILESKVNGHLSTQSSGKNSVRKKKSKILNGGDGHANGSATSL